ncbi:Peroxisomal membrane signal receptor PTS1, variant 2 [Orbilia oligospora]|uniref:Peroxisomal targeting signal receptor n=2 Tax=Orbilia oligospora TaxID=2813651 RepID=A0A7C8K6M7_ORBOL|nr:Peroxisomal membrane signal receptor PTS1, variant 2 [Orbilia oligospora]KAF3084487.1 Peroxisomal membrane signal receptor PTS1 [Orbilia oligospora]KAF3084489.1 Peroxisomal membrane signal receptor PTS1, variant 3 [Orbilia oligospora]KAF3109066.1 Peroxisomal membrane signal receptor PTS1 [Orbilia oligospora]KAF3109068.1 Peroxisomal membrane signal receptor PTS1, variant 3 [Orbilia oligospora]
MSFLGGAECSTGRNPLAQFTKHVSDDKSLQRDRMVGGIPGGPGIQQGMRSQGMVQGPTGDQQMEQFLMQDPAAAQQSAGPFQFDGMRAELNHIPAGQVNWAAEFATMPPGEDRAQLEAAFHAAQAKGEPFNPAEFAAFQHQPHQHVHTPQPDLAAPMNAGNAYYPQRFQGYSMGGMYSGGFARQASQIPTHTVPETATTAKGKERVVELTDEDWQTQFKQIEEQQHEPVVDEDSQANRAIEEELEKNGEAMFSDFEPLWDGIQKDMEANGVKVDDWNWEPGTLPGQPPNLGEYLFEQENPYMQVGNPFEEGIRLMESHGNLSLAALAFEAACQKNPSHVEAWERLGASQAQNEKETPAIRALEQALKLEPQNMNALMGLAISYTNEGYDTTAYNTLERWLNARYPDITSPAVDNPLDRLAIHSRVTDLFIRAAVSAPEGAAFDSDVQVGLGVLFYGAEEYDKAVDCFSSALESDYDARDKNHLLWNRLGATLANSGRSEEAIEAYEKALTINPNFVRARYNLGVSCINIGCYEEAAQHLLGALAMHKVITDRDAAEAQKIGVDVTRIEHNQSTNLYDTLRRVFGQMNRRDLADLVANGMDVDVFRKEFEF